MWRTEKQIRSIHIWTNYFPLGTSSSAKCHSVSSPASYFHQLPHKILAAHWSPATSSLALGRLSVIHYSLQTSSCLPSQHTLCVYRRCRWPGKIESIEILTHLRGPPSSYGGMMTTLTVTDVLSRSIICSWVSVTAATLQISTNRLPCLRPACQAKPYSSTWKGREKIRVWDSRVCDRDLGWAAWRYLSHGAVQPNMEAQLSQSVPP